MEVKTLCNETYGSETTLSITFCHESQFGTCCSIPTLPAQASCSNNSYATNDPIMEDCAEFDFISEKMKGILTFTNVETTDMYGGDWIKLTLKDGSVLSCDIEAAGLIFGTEYHGVNGNGDGNTGPLSLNFDCLPLSLLF